MLPLNTNKGKLCSNDNVECLLEKVQNSVVTQTQNGLCNQMRHGQLNSFNMRFGNLKSNINFYY